MTSDALTATAPNSQWIGCQIAAADAVFQLTGSWTGTVTFEGCVEGQEGAAVPIAVSAVATPGTLVTSATANGIFRTNNGWAGGMKLRARFSTPTSGTVVVNAQSADWR